VASVTHGLFYSSLLDDLKDVFSDHVKDKKFLDLGSGDGGVVSFASDYTEKARGIEIDKPLYDNSAVKNKITHGNFFHLDFSQEEVLYYYLKGSMHELELIQKLNKEFKGILIINYRTMHEKQVNVFASFLNFEEIRSYPNVKVYRKQ